jgi:Fe-S cluster assembly protein SufD
MRPENIPTDLLSEQREKALQQVLSITDENKLWQDADLKAMHTDGLTGDTQQVPAWENNPLIPFYYGHFVKNHHPLAQYNLMSNEHINLIHLTQSTETPHVIRRQLQGNQSSTHYHLIILESHVHAQIVIEHSNLDSESSFDNHVIEILLKKGANVELYCHQKLNPKTNLAQVITVRQEESSELFVFSVDQGGQFVRRDIDVQLAGHHATCELNGFYQVQDTARVGNHVTIDHQVSHTHSQQLYKGTAQDKARADYQGKIIIQKNTRQCTTTQLNKNILLNNTATINTKPELEIYADDVTASHGATVGELDEAALFYLQSRGINLEQAKALLLEGFINDVFNTIPDATLKECLQC